MLGNIEKLYLEIFQKKPQFWLDESKAVVNGDCYWIDIYPEVFEETVYLALAIANSKFIEKYYDIKFNTKLLFGKEKIYDSVCRTISNSIL